MNLSMKKEKFELTFIENDTRCNPIFIDRCMSQPGAELCNGFAKTSLSWTRTKHDHGSPCYLCFRPKNWKRLQNLHDRLFCHHPLSQNEASLQILYVLLYTAVVFPTWHFLFIQGGPKITERHTSGNNCK